MWLQVLELAALVAACVCWQLAEAVGWVIVAALYVSLLQVSGLFKEGAMWDKLADPTLEGLRNWRLGLGAMTVLGIVASCVIGLVRQGAWAANDPTPVLDSALMTTALAYVAAVIPSAVALYRHSVSAPDAKSARSALAVATFFRFVYGVFAFIMTAYSTTLNDANDQLWRTIAAYLVWVAILNLIYTEYGPTFSPLRFCGYLAFYIVLTLRLHDSADELNKMKFQHDTDIVVLGVAGAALCVSLFI